MFSGFIHSFSITKEENKHIKLVNKSDVSVNLTLEIFGKIGNESTFFDILLLNTNSTNALSTLFQKQYFVDEKDMSMDGVITVQFPIKGDYFGEFGFYKVFLVARLQNSTLFNESIPLSISYDEEIGQVYVSLFSFYIFLYFLIQYIFVLF